MLAPTTNKIRRPGRRVEAPVLLCCSNAPDLPLSSRLPVFEGVYLPPTLPPSHRLSSTTTPASAFGNDVFVELFQTDFRIDFVPFRRQPKRPPKRPKTRQDGFFDLTWAHVGANMEPCWPQNCIPKVSYVKTAGD